jgi:two-component system, response regulator YesN
MFRIVIADDEERIRRGLAKLVRSASEDYEVAGVFANGAELLKFLKEEGADVVITDIRMPVMDGLQVAEKLQAEHPGVRCVIVSGYSDFDYARTAMRHQVRDYLLKPVDKAELYRVLREMAKEIAEARRQTKIFRRHRLERALAGEASAEPVIPDDAFAVWYVVRTEAAVGLDTLEAAANAEDVRSCAIAVRDRTYGVLLELDAGASLTSAPERAGFALAAALTEHTGAAIGASLPFRGAKRLREAFAEAEMAAGKAFYRFERAVFVPASEAGPQQARPARFSDWYKSWETEYVRSLQILDAGKIEQELNAFFEEMRRRQEAPGVLMELLIRMLELAEREVGGFAEEAEELFGPADRRLEELSRFFKYDPLRQWFTERMIDAIVRIRERRSGSVRAVDALKAIIATSYHEDLDLGMLAERVYLTPSYLSRLFKQETGVTITDYLINVRIEQAKNLLRSRPDLKTYEVGEQVGYPDSAYFTKLFKRIVGMTPNEYRQIVR